MGQVNDSILVQVISKIKAIKLEVIIVGNSASALLGAPVTTMDIDFMIRNTQKNIQKLKDLADSLGGYLNQPFLPASKLYRIITNDIQLDFMVQVDGIKSFESLRSRAEVVKLGQYDVYVSSLRDVIKSKQAVNRSKDQATLDILKKTLEVKKKLL